MAETFADDDHGYETWLHQHPAGFVLNCDRNPRASHLMLHRSTCHTISGTLSRGSVWTAASTKVGADTIGDLEAWALAATGGTPQRCGTCGP